jgi:acetyltransferase-like isoleucine patch superfamily enzyme
MPYLTIDPNKPGLGHTAEYYTDRDIEIDCRGPLNISFDSYWGIGVKVITASHEPGNMSIVKYLPVTVEAGAWICSYAILYNCHIGENAIVAIGAVVRSRNVPDGTMVEGNPARVIARLVNDKWEYIDYQIPLEAKK